MERTIRNKFVEPFRENGIQKGSNIQRSLIHLAKINPTIETANYVQIIVYVLYSVFCIILRVFCVFVCLFFALYCSNKRNSRSVQSKNKYGTSRIHNQWLTKLFAYDSSKSPTQTLPSGLLLLLSVTYCCRSNLYNSLARSPYWFKLWRGTFFTPLEKKRHLRCGQIDTDM